MLYNTGSAISGSLALQFLMEEDYGNIDMDLYVPREHEETFSALFAEQDYSDVSSPDPLEEPYSFVVQISVKKLYNEKTNSSVDLISPTVYFRGNPGDVGGSFVESAIFMFDFSCCMNFFNGRHLFSYYHELTISKVCLLMGCPQGNTLEEIRKKSRDRTNKYRKRGFVVIGDHSHIPPDMVHRSGYLEAATLSLVPTSRLPEGSYTNIYNITDDRKDIEKCISLVKDGSRGFFHYCVLQNEKDGIYGPDWEPLTTSITYGQGAPYINVVKDSSLCVMVNDRRVTDECYRFLQLTPQLKCNKHNRMLSLMLMLEDIGLPVSEGHGGRRNKFCVRLSCEIMRKPYHEDLIVLAYAPPGEYPNSPLYSKGGSAYREAARNHV
jgi:hypothetical protein